MVSVQSQSPHVTCAVTGRLALLGLSYLHELGLDRACRKSLPSEPTWRANAKWLLDHEILEADLLATEVGSRVTLPFGRVNRHVGLMVWASSSSGGQPPTPIPNDENRKH